MKKKNIHLSVVAVLGGLLALTACSGDNGENGGSDEIQSVATSGAESSPYLQGAELANIFSENTDHNIQNQASGGFNENPGLVDSQDMEFGLGLELDLLNAYEGSGPFDEPHEGLRRVMTVAVSPYHVISTQGSEMTSLNDFQGNSVNLGVVTQTTRTINDGILEALQISPDDVDVHSITTGEAFTAIQDGVINASANFFAQGFGGMQDFSNTANASLVEVSDEELAAIQEHFDGLLSPYTIPGGTYAGIDDDVDTFSMAVVLYAHEDVSDEVVHDVVEAYHDHFDELSERELFSGVELEQLRGDTPVPEHQGATDYFEAQD